MEKQQNKTVEVQGTETKRPERRISISLETLRELTENIDLKEEFIKVLKENEEMKAPIALQFAKAKIKQTKLTI